MPIDSKHPQYLAKCATWEKIEDVTRVKNLARHLRVLNAHDLSPENTQRNTDYQKHAVFYALAQQTASGMVGTAYRKWPTMAVPTEMEYLQTNADGGGVSIYQQSQAVADDLIRKGRAGLAVSFPATEGQVSRADILSGRVVATIHRFEPEQIINWRTETVGSQTRLSLVLLSQAVEQVAADGYGVEYVQAIRELYLDDGIYREREWRHGLNGWTPVSESTPLDASGKPWGEIPFTFLGSENNDPSIDMPPMLGICDLNIAHYRNSADYEDSVWYSGQAQPWMSGATVDFLSDLKAAGVYIGGRNLLAVPEGGQFGYASADPNPMVRQAMLDKVDMMVGLGARMITHGSVAKTATQSMGERDIQHSVLSLIASNVSEAYTQALKWCARYMGATVTDDMAYTVSQDFISPDATPQEIQALVAGYIQGAIPMPDYVARMQRIGVFIDDKPIDEYAEQLAVPGSGVI